MTIQRVAAVYWSATGSTAKLVTTMAKAAADHLRVPLEETDFTRPAARETTYAFGAGDLVFFATPTYAGKVPNKVLPFVQTGFQGGGALAVPVVTFGNRSFDNSLAELAFELEKAGFHTVAAAAFVARHAFTDALAPGRPDWDDLAQAADFAVKAADKAAALDSIPAPIAVPGDAAAAYYVPKGTDGQPAKFLKAKPLTNLGKCTNCGACARLCPMGAIDPADVTSVPGTCIKCQACVRRCTKHAKYFDDPAFLSHVAMLEQNFTDRKESVTLL